MKCSKCNAVLADDAKFCTKCGTTVSKEGKVTTVKSNSSINSNDVMDYIVKVLVVLLNVLLKPIKTVKQSLKDFCDIKSATIVALIVAVSGMIANLLSKLISSIFVKSMVSYAGDTKLEVTFDNLGDLPYVDLIFKKFIMFLIIIVVISAVYYVGSLILKKSVSFAKILTATSLSIVPVLASCTLLATILSYFYYPLAIFVIFAGLVYSTITLIISMNDIIEIKDDNMKVYFNTATILVLFITEYYVVMNTIQTSLGSITSFLK